MGGLDLGLERAGMTVAWQVEKEPFCRQVLKKHWPDVPCYGDIKELDPHDLTPVDLIAGGFPCQPFSLAGHQRGTNDERWMWPEFERVVRILRPRFVLVENVDSLPRDALAWGWILADLHQLGFDAEWSIVSACSVGAPHRRNRVFLLAYPQGDDGPGDVPSHPGPTSRRGLEPGGSGREPWSEWWLSEPAVDRVAHGVPRRVVLGPLTGLGNAVVPQVAEYVGRRIMAMA